MPVTKVATCSYCGTRAALVLAGRDRHELSCQNCGAPLHDLKQMPRSEGRKAPKSASRYGGHDGKEMPRRKPEKRKRRKGFGARVFEELWDVIEDVID